MTLGLEEIVMRLVGPVTAAGNSRIDAERLQNLKHLTLLIDRLLMFVHEASMSADRPEASMRIIGQHAKDFLQEIREA